MAQRISTVFISMKNNPGKKIYFISDFHLGTHPFNENLKIEKLIVNWLNDIKTDASDLFLLGDIFDFWFEYKKVIPKGHIRLLGKLAELSDEGINLHIFTGNHDLWMKDYFEKELNAVIYRNPVLLTLSGKTFYLAHGDGLGPGDYGYKFINKIFKNKFCQWLFRWLHPDIGIKIAELSSSLSRAQENKHRDVFLGEKEWLVQHSREILKTGKINYFIYGHRHYPMKYQLNENSWYINLGDMMRHFTYAVFDGDKIELKELANSSHL
jgi:UDP-2,3-diacylglucosamine hydrolase